MRARIYMLCKALIKICYEVVFMLWLFINAQHVYVSTHWFSYDLVLFQVLVSAVKFPTQSVTQSSWWTIYTSWYLKQTEKLVTFRNWVSMKKDSFKLAVFLACRECCYRVTRQVSATWAGKNHRIIQIRGLTSQFFLLSGFWDCVIALMGKIFQNLFQFLSNIPSCKSRTSSCSRSAILQVAWQ